MSLPSFDDFEFYTFITGLENKEQDLINNLLKTFPYKKTHKLNIIDKSKYVLDIFNSNGKIYYSERHFIYKKTLNFDRDKWSTFCINNEEKINIIYEEKFTSHVESMQNVIYNFSKKKFVIFLDSDVSFKNEKLLSDLINFLKLYEIDINEIGAIGQIHQESPFSLPFKKFFSHEFYKIFLNDNRLSIYKILKNCFFQIFKKNNVKSNRIHKLPRLWTSCLVINKDLFVKEKIISKNLWLEVFDKTKNSSFQSHRVMGDSGASFLFGIALCGKKIINLPLESYVKHKRSGSRNKDQTQIAKSWLSFDF